jgi:chemotaxis protein CheX
VADRNRADEARRTLVLRALTHKHFFAGLLAEAETIFDHLLGFESRPATEEESAQLLVDLHTFKGNLGFFGFSTAQEVAHDFEYAIQDSQVLGVSLDVHDVGLDLKRAYFQELNIITEALGKDWLEEAGGIVIPRPVFEKVAVYVGKKFPSEAHLVDVLEHYRKLPLRDLFSRFPFVAQATAERLGKRISPMTILGGDLRVPPDRVEALVNSCVHIVNNMVDHGIELPYVREAQGKPPEGRLVLNLVRESRSVVIQFIDDGQGISLPVIEARGRSLGLVASDAVLSPRDILQLLFLPGFSTREEASEVSGRGVGLAAVRQEAERLGGRLEVQTSLRQPEETCMKVEYANPFVLAAVQTFQKEIGVKLSRKELKLKDSPVPSQAISIIIGVTGAVRGQVVLSIDENVAMAVTKAMLPGKLPVELKKLVNSAVSELANIITGQASILLAGDSGKIDITPPAIVMGPALRMDFLSLQTICLSFLSEIGSLELNIALTEGTK